MFWYCVHNTYNHFRVTKIDFLQVSEVLYIFSSERDCLNMSSHWETKNLYHLFSNKQHLLTFWHTLTVSFQICKNAGLVWLLHFDPLTKVRSSVQRCSVKKVFLKFSQNSQPQACNFSKKRLSHRCFPVNFTKFLRTLFFRTPLVAASDKRIVQSKVLPTRKWLQWKLMKKSYQNHDHDLHVCLKCHSWGLQLY